MSLRNFRLTGQENDPEKNLEKLRFELKEKIYENLTNEDVRESTYVGAEKISELIEAVDSATSKGRLNTIENACDSMIEAKENRNQTRYTDVPLSEDQGVDMDQFNPDDPQTYDGPNFKEVENFSEGELSEESLKERFDKAREYLQDLLSRIAILEIKADQNDEEHKQFNDALKDVDKIVMDLGNHDDALDSKIEELKLIVEQIRSNSPSTSVSIEIPDQGDIKKKVKTISKDTVLPKEFDSILQLALGRQNIYLYGPTGAGKSFLASKIAEVLDLPFYSQSCSAGMDETVFTGRLLPSENGVWAYRKSKFVDMYTNGGVFCLDEGDKMSAELLTFINTALSNSWFYNELNDGEMIKRHEDFILIMTGNTAGHGGNMNYFSEELDVSTLRRFQTGMLYIGYSEEVEKKIIDPVVYAWGRVMREAIDFSRVERLTVSTGLLLEISKMKKLFKWERKVWEKSFFAGQSEDVVKKLKEIVDKNLRAIAQGL